MSSFLEESEEFGEFSPMLNIRRKSFSIDNCRIEKDVCSHTETENGICLTCSCEIKILDFEPEWRFYGSSDNKLSKDPSRCQMMGRAKSNIDKIFVDHGLGKLFSEKIKLMTNIRYKKIAGDGTYRGVTKKSIVAACLLHVLSDNGDFRTSEEIRKLLGLTKKKMHEGINRYYEVFPKQRGRKKTAPSGLVGRTMKNVKLPMEHYQVLFELTKELENTDHDLTRSTPQAVVSSIIYCYITMVPELQSFSNKTEFSNKVGISEITIGKLVKIISNKIGEICDR